jgi:hypothetical protein
VPNEMTSSVDLMDVEIPHVQEVLDKINEKQWKGGVDLEAFRKEIIERFGQDWRGPDGNDWPGLVVNVKVYTTNEEGLYAFDIDIERRTWEPEGGLFDHDRQVHDVTGDMLGLGTGGVIKTDGGLFVPGGHNHQHGHGHQHH